MKRFKLTLTIRYQHAERKRGGINPAKDYTEAMRNAAKLVNYQTEVDADYGPPLSIKLSLRELQPKAKR